MPSPQISLAGRKMDVAIFLSRLEKKKSARLKMVVWFAYGQRGSGKTETAMKASEFPN